MTEAAAVTDTNSQAAGTQAAADNSLLNGQNTQDNAGTQGATPQVAKEGEPAKTEAAPQGAPEVYEKFTVPEGMTLDEESFTEFTGLAKELNLNQESAQKVSDIGAKLVSKVLQASEAQRESEKAAQIVAWKDAVITDKEIGGDKLQATLAVANTFLDEFGSKELVDTLEQYGLTNNPAVIKAFAKAGKAISSDKVLTGSASAPEKTAAQVLFPTFNQ